jgi:putative tryptophan/tyrosine transport system substrate-binding protein
MRESCMYGSVRGARGNSRPYRDRREGTNRSPGAAQHEAPAEWCAADPGSLQTPNLERSRISGAPLRFASRCAASGTPIIGRREFISLLGGAAATSIAWPLAARAQQPAGIRRIGALMDTAEDNPEGQARIAAFRQGLQELGWTQGRNIRIDLRWGGGDIERTRAYAAELVGLKPDVIFAYAAAQLAPLSRETRTIPIIFVGASAPVEDGYVASFAHPGGNITGFTQYEPSMAGKWLAALKEIAPAIARVALLVNPDTAPLRGTFYARAFEAAAATLAVEPITAFVHSASEIEAAMAALARQPDSGLIVAPETFTTTNRELIVALAARHRVPATYGLRQFPVSGGLLSYGPDTVDTVRRAASYVDRILRGEKPAELPVQAPTKFEMVVNLKTAKALGLAIPESFLLRADEVIE